MKVWNVLRRKRKRERVKREAEREWDCVPAIRTRDRPIIDVPYRCMAPGITSTKTVPSRISTAPFLSHPPFSLPVTPSCAISLPIANSHPFGQFSLGFFSPFHRGRSFRGKTSIKLIPLERKRGASFSDRFGAACLHLVSSAFSSPLVKTGRASWSACGLREILQ